jgi:hypothetical protein
MPILRIANQVKGLIPVLDPRQVKDIFVIDGKNFLVDAEGPYSAFGMRWANRQQVFDTRNLCTFEVGDEVFVFTNSCVLGYDKVADVYYPLFTFDFANGDFPWTYALVGGVHYFARQNVGVVYYNPSTEYWGIATGTLLPTTPYSVAEAGGRLVVLGADYIAWSNIDDGLDLEPDPSTGTGAQALSIIGGSPLGVYKTIDGFLVYTTKGILKGTLTGTVIPYRFDGIAGEEFVPVSPYCITIGYNNYHYLLTPSGICRTIGKVPETWQPVMGEYFTKKLFPFADLSNAGLFRLSFSRKMRLLFISLSETGTAFEYTKAFVCYMPKEEWGVCNHQHVCCGVVPIQRPSTGGFNYGYFNYNGIAFYASEYQYSEIPPDETDGFYKTLEHTYIAFIDGTGTAEFVTFGEMYSEDPAQYPEVAGIYVKEFGDEYISPDTLEADAETAVATIGLDLLYGSGVVDFLTEPNAVVDFNAIPDSSFETTGVGGFGMEAAFSSLVGSTYLPLNSYIDVGLLRFNESQYPDELNGFDFIHVGTDDVPGEHVVTDFLTEADLVVDFLTAADLIVDLGDSPAFETSYGISVRGTLDGTNVFEENERVPDLVVDDGGMKLYSVYNVGLYHRIKLTALEENESFHLKLLEVSGSLNGRV